MALEPNLAENVWLPAGGDAAEIVRWIGKNTIDAEYTRRVLFIPNKNHFDARDDAVKVYGGNGNIGTNRSPSVTRGGPVFAYAPDLQLLGYAIQAADGQLLAVAAHNDEEISGWVAATNALNVLPASAIPACRTIFAKHSKTATTRGTTATTSGVRSSR